MDRDGDANGTDDGGFVSARHCLHSFCTPIGYYQGMTSRDDFHLRDLFAYPFSVTIATATFMLPLVGTIVIHDHINPLRSDLLVVLAVFGVIGWIFIFVTSLVPYSMAMFMANHWRIRHWSFFVAAGSATSAVVCLLFRCIPDFGFNVEYSEPEPTFLEGYLRSLPFFITCGAVTGFARYFVGPREGRYVAEPGASAR